MNSKTNWVVWMILALTSIAAAIWASNTVWVGSILSMWIFVAIDRLEQILDQLKKNRINE